MGKGGQLIHVRSPDVELHLTLTSPSTPEGRDEGDRRPHTSKLSKHFACITHDLKLSKISLFEGEQTNVDVGVGHSAVSGGVNGSQHMPDPTKFPDLCFDLLQNGIGPFQGGSL